MSDPKVTAAHLRRAAAVYCRQSTLIQVERNRESTLRQYDLVSRADALGWPRAAVRVIDADLGVSGSGLAARAGFTELTEQIALGQVGVVLALEVSRLARSSAEWYRLLDLCGITDTLIADESSVYHPGMFDDRLLLGLKGTMAEALCRYRHKASLGYSFNRSRLGRVEQLRAGTHYPRSTGEFQAWFRADEDCLDYLKWLRWPGGFTCPSCGHAGGWAMGDGRFECAACHRRTSVTAGTIFDRTRTPLTVWFTACWLFATQKDGISAQSLQRSLEIGSYPTAWAMLHRLRSVLVRPGRDRLSGTVQVDETFIGGDEPGLRGGRAKGKKVLTGIAVEVSEPKGIGRCRMAVLADGSAESLHPFVTGAVEPGATVITDAWMGYHGLAGLGYVHERRSQRAARARGDDPGELLPAVHRVASLAKRWLLGTHQGSVDEAHLPAYLDEFVFRFNRRRSASRGMVFYRLLELAAGHDPVRFQDLLASKKPHAQRPQPPQVRGHPPSLDRSRANWPWRTGELQLQLPIPLRLNEYPRSLLCRPRHYADLGEGIAGLDGET